MTPAELAKARTTHPAYWGTFIEDLIARLRLDQATPALTIPEMASHVSDLEVLRQLLPLADLLLAEAIDFPVPIGDAPALKRAVANAYQMQRFAQEVWAR